ncbi:MAG: hypothetical protein JWM10_1101 [Myxococcaceae bacterium]|nr:hypothetical protein [Myxococcaceae bacterium]
MQGTSSELLLRLEADELLRRDGSGHRTTRRWQAAMARAAFRLMRAGAADDDLRLPVACAIVEFYQDLPNDELARLLEVLTPIEAAELTRHITTLEQRGDF